MAAKIVGLRRTAKQEWLGGHKLHAASGSSHFGSRFRLRDGRCWVQGRVCSVRFAGGTEFLLFRSGCCTSSTRLGPVFHAKR